MTKIRILKEEENKIKDLKNKICRFAEYYEKGKKGRSLELAALIDVLFCIKEIFKSHDSRFRKEHSKYRKG